MLIARPIQGVDNSVMPLRLWLSVTVAVLFAAGTLAVRGRVSNTNQSPRVGEATSPTVVEIRAYTLKAGTRERFHELFVRESLPMLRRQTLDVVAYGPSLHDSTSYFLLRSFASLEDRTRSEERFYGSREWLDGPRTAVLAAIESYSTAVGQVDRETLEALRGLSQRVEHAKQGDVMPQTPLAGTATASDVATLVSLNDDYIRSVETSDVKRFREILAEDFLCSLPDGSHIGRDAFLEHVAEPSHLSGLRAHDVNVRVMGDFALVHARTTFVRDGRPGASRYTDAWARRNGRWVAIAAHVTRF